MASRNSLTIRFYFSDKPFFFFLLRRFSYNIWASLARILHRTVAINLMALFIYNYEVITQSFSCK